MDTQERSEDSWFDIAIRNYKHSNYAQAVLAITKHIEENPETRNGKLLKAVICRALKNYNQGVYTLEEIIPQEEDTWQYKRTYYREFGETLQSMGKYDEAIVWFDKLIEAVPDQAQGYILKGECLESLEQYELAQLQYIRATQLKGNKEDAFYNLALLFRKDMNFIEAKMYCKKALEIDPNDSIFQHFYNDIVEAVKFNELG